MVVETEDMVVEREKKEQLEKEEQLEETTEMAAMEKFVQVYEKVHLVLTKVLLLSIRSFVQLLSRVQEYCDTDLGNCQRRT
jgi:hypothetical protein